MASEARSIGWGGISIVSKSTGLSRTTIGKGIKEITCKESFHIDRIRRTGGGRKRLEKHDPTLRSDILACVEPTSRGDPESPLRWTSNSLVNIVKALKSRNPTRQVGVSVVRRILHEEGYSLQSNRKIKEGGTHPDRDLQFQNIAQNTRNFLEKGNPVISIDAKKKELIGNYKNGGREWNPKGEPTAVQVYDFLPKDGIKAVPYGIYDIAWNRGFVNVGVSADTAVFAGRSILKWWEEEGHCLYPDATELLITADGGGSNGTRVRLWKVIVQELTNKIGIPITICHYPPGTSKWNKIEHRLFSAITMNWRGKPLRSLDEMVERISHTKNKRGLKVTCRMDLAKYQRGIRIFDNRMAGLNLVRQEFHGEWNYSMYPKTLSRN